jgi:hypothetical protein
MPRFLSSLIPAAAFLCQSFTAGSSCSPESAGLLFQHVLLLQLPPSALKSALPLLTLSTMHLSRLCTSGLGLLINEQALVDLVVCPIQF